MHTITHTLFSFIFGTLLLANCIVFTDACGNNGNTNGNATRQATNTTTPTPNPANTMRETIMTTANDTGATAMTNATNAGVTRTENETAGEVSRLQVDFNATIKVENNQVLTIEYTATNRGANSVLIANRGDTSFGLRPDRVYFEPQADGGLDLTQKAYMPPANYKGSLPTAAIYPGVTTLEAGKSTSEKLTVPLPLPVARQHPYGRYYPPTQSAQPPRKVRFCLGIISAEATKTSLDRNTRINTLPSLQAIARQEVLCSTAVQLP